MTTFNDTYEIKSIIGQGGMSTVYLAEHKRLHTRWAVKQVRKEQGARFDFLAESNLLKKLQHPMLPRIVDIFEDAECIYIVEDFVEGVTLEWMRIAAWPGSPPCAAFSATSTARSPTPLSTGT